MQSLQYKIVYWHHLALEKDSSVQDGVLVTTEVLDSSVQDGVVV